MFRKILLTMLLMPFSLVISSCGNDDGNGNLNLTEDRILEALANTLERLENALIRHAVWDGDVNYIRSYMANIIDEHGNSFEVDVAILNDGYIIPTMNDGQTGLGVFEFTNDEWIIIEENDRENEISFKVEEIALEIGSFLGIFEEIVLVDFDSLTINSHNIEFSFLESEFTINFMYFNDDLVISLIMVEDVEEVNISFVFTTVPIAQEKLEVVEYAHRRFS